MLESKCTDKECNKYNENMPFSCMSYAWDYVRKCHTPEIKYSDNTAPNTHGGQPVNNERTICQR